MAELEEEISPGQAAGQVGSALVGAGCVAAHLFAFFPRLPHEEAVSVILMGCPYWLYRGIRF